MSNSSPYKIGGSLQIDDPSYVTRKADEELYKGLISGEYCYVLNCRQMGKSSLRVRTAARLKKEGITCVAIQMTSILDEENTPEQFYAGVINSITQELDLDFDDTKWWDENSRLSLVNRFSNFLETVLLQQVSGRVVIFIDEIDRVLSLSFRVDGFFAAVKECFNKRADNSDFRRLTFSLLGVATPADLIADKSSTPFNVGKAIELTGFTLDEAMHLKIGLQVEHPTEVMSSILRWTGGQPFLTQKLCQIVAMDTSRSSLDKDITSWVDSIVHEQIIQNWHSNDEPEHLRTIRDRLLLNDPKAISRLALYQEVLLQDGVLVDTTGSPSREYIELRLSGVAVSYDGRLCVYNSIYASIFTLAWTKEALANLRPYATEFSRWIESGKTDQSSLLTGERLAEVIQWTKRQSLPPEDYSFIVSSQSLQSQKAEEGRQELAKTNQRLGGQLGGQRTQQKNREKRIREKELAIAEREAIAEETIEQGLKKYAEGIEQIQKAEQILALSNRQSEDNLLTSGSDTAEPSGCVGCLASIGAISLVVLSIRFILWIF